MRFQNGEPIIGLLLLSRGLSCRLLLFTGPTDKPRKENSPFGGYLMGGSGKGNNRMAAQKMTLGKEIVGEEQPLNQ